MKCTTIIVMVMFFIVSILIAWRASSYVTAERLQQEIEQLTGKVAFLEVRESELEFQVEIAPAVELMTRVFCGEFRSGTFAEQIDEWNKQASALWNRKGYEHWPENPVSLILYNNEVNAVADHVEEDMDSTACKNARIFADIVLREWAAGTFTPFHRGRYWVTPERLPESSFFQDEQRIFRQVAEGAGHVFLELVTFAPQHSKRPLQRSPSTDMIAEIVAQEVRIAHN